MSPRSDSVRSRANLQTITLEYIVDGAFDGSTIAPQIGLDPGSANYVAPDPVDQIRRVVLPAGQPLGLIDLSLVSNNSEGGTGDRYVRWVVAGNASETFSDGVLAVVDDLHRTLQILDDPLVLEIVRTMSGLEYIYERSCIFVPQGGYISISGMPRGERPSVIRLNVQAPQTDWEGAIVEESCCCDTGGGSPPSVDCPTILDVSPAVIATPGDPTTLTFFGTGFRDGLAIQAIRVPPASPVAASLTSFVIVDSNTATVDVVDPTPLGTYTITIFDPENPTTCFSTASLRVLPEDSCPGLNAENPISPATAEAGGIPVSFVLRGSGLTNVASFEIRDLTGGVIVSQLSSAFVSQTFDRIETGPIAIPPVGAQPAFAGFIPSDEEECSEIFTGLLLT